MSCQLRGTSTLVLFLSPLVADSLISDNLIPAHFVTALLQACKKKHILHMQNLEVQMKATVVDLKHKMKDVLEALEKREKITLLYHGKVKGFIIPADGQKIVKVVNHPFFKMAGKRAKSVEQQMNELRGSRFNAL
jgi:hypothetical protein